MSKSTVQVNQWVRVHLNQWARVQVNQWVRVMSNMQGRFFYVEYERVWVHAARTNICFP